MKKKLLISMIFLMVLMAFVVHSVVTGEKSNPVDGFYWIIGGSVMGNTSFNGNATPSGATGNIQNISLYHNISGTWGVNSTNHTVGTIGTTTLRTFDQGNTSIYAGDLTDGSSFSWNLYACDNVTKFYDETVALSSDELTIFDNYTTTCGSTCGNAVIVTAGRGRLSNYPLSSLDRITNTTNEGISGCVLNDSTNGYFYCNQTTKTYNGSVGLLSTANMITSSVILNYTISSSCRFLGANRTVYVEDAPTVNLVEPADAAVLNDSTVLFYYNVSGDADVYSCQVYSNDTGSWVEEVGGNTATNNTRESTNKVISESNGIVWNIRCSESTNSNIFGWALNNYTVSIDSTNPSITSSAKDYSNSVLATAGYSAFINLTVLDANPNNCILYINGLSNNTLAYTNNNSFAQYFNASDGTYKWQVICDDDTSKNSTTANTTIVIDTVTPSLSSKNNGSDITSCKGWELNFTLSESANFTLEYGLSVDSKTYFDTETDYNTNQSLELIFNDSYETLFYSNFTFCDRSGNCNDTVYGDFLSPIHLCTGWSIWSVYDSGINLTDYRVASGADYVYYWNNTGQSWIYSSAAGSLNPDHTMIVGDAVHLYESTNTTYFRNNTGSSKYLVNITAGHAYFGLYNDYVFGNISYNLFRNSSGGNNTPDSTWAGGLRFDILYLSSFNNSNQQYVDSIFEWNWNNQTAIGKNEKTGLDALWAFVPQNISFNFTTNGYVYGNWT